MSIREKIDHQISLLAIYRGNARHYLKQARAHGGLDKSPPVTRNGLIEVQINIRCIKHLLDRNYSVIVESAFEDTARAWDDEQCKDWQ